MRKLILAIEALSIWSGRIISWVILTMVGAIGYEVLMRYIFNAPTSWAHELTTMQYGGYCMLLGAYTHVQNGHVRMDAIYRRFSVRVQAGIDVVTGLLGLGFLVIFFLSAAKFAKISWDSREISSMTTWAPPFYPFKIALAVGVLLFLLQHIATILRSLLTVCKREDLVPENFIESK